VNVRPAFESNAQLGEGSKPAVSAFDAPAMFAESVMTRNAAARDARFNAAFAQMPAAEHEVISLFRMEFLWPAAWSAGESRDRWNRINQCLEDKGVMAIGASQHERQ
jgi:hypothetical protein